MNGAIVGRINFTWEGCDSCAFSDANGGDCGTAYFQTPEIERDDLIVCTSFEALCAVQEQEATDE